MHRVIHRSWGVWCGLIVNHSVRSGSGWFLKGSGKFRLVYKKLKGNTTVVKYFFFLPVRKIAPSDKIIIRG